MPQKQITDLPTRVSMNLTDYIHIKQGSEDVKVLPATLFALHLADSNPHNIDKTDVGLGNVSNNLQLVASNNLSDLTDVVAARAALGVQSETDSSGNLVAHASSTSNPHSVTKTQVGLGNVANYGNSDNYQLNSSSTYATSKAVRDLYEYVASLDINPIPAGGIIAWSGASIPSGWALCDGTNGTPDLRNKFVMGGTTVLDTGNTGGTNAVDYALTATVENHTLTINQIPSHTHRIKGTASQNVTTTTTGSTDLWRTAALTERGDIEETGGGQPHNHGITISNVDHDNRPAFYTLAFIMKL